MFSNFLPKPGRINFFNFLRKTATLYGVNDCQASFQASLTPRDTKDIDIDLAITYPKPNGPRWAGKHRHTMMAPPATKVFQINHMKYESKLPSADPILLPPINAIGSSISDKPIYNAISNAAKKLA